MISKNFSWLIPMTYPPQSTVTPASMFKHVMMKMPCCEAIRTNLMQSCFNQVEYSNLSNLDKRNLRGNRNSILRKGGAVRLAAAFLLLLTVNMHAQTSAPDSSTVLNHIIGDSLQNRAGESAPATPESQTLLLDANPAPDTAGLSGLADRSGNRSRTEKKLVDHKHLEIEYSTGLAARQRQHWTYAALVFERILDNDPNFRDTRAQLTEVEAYLKQMSTDSVLAGCYGDALYAMDRVDLGMARRALQKIHSLNPNYRDVAEYLAEIEMMLGWNRGVAPSQFVSNMTISLRDSLNRDVLHALRHEDWMRATISFEKLKIIHPSYRDVEDLLQERWENMGGDTQQKTAVEPGRLDDVWPYLGGAFAAVVVLFMFSIVGSAPTLRARYFLWRGNFQRAAIIYEKILERDPARVKYFMPLAEIYLGLGKEDERAVKLYKTVLQLNLVTHQRDAMKTIVAQAYVAQGSTDGEGIEFLEHALETEMRKQSLMLASGKEA